MDIEELLQRLDIIIGAEVDSSYHAFNSLDGALIRLTQAYGDERVAEKVSVIRRRANEFIPRGR